MIDSLKVIYLEAEELRLKDKALSGRLSLHRDSLTIVGESSVQIPLAAIREGELVFSQLGHFVRVLHAGGTLWLGAYRLNLWGWFVVLNKSANRRLAERVQELISQSRELDQDSSDRP